MMGYLIDLIQLQFVMENVKNRLSLNDLREHLMEMLIGDQMK